MLADWLMIDGIMFDVKVTSIKEKGEVLYSDKTGRTIDIGAPMVLDPLGTFYNYTITVKRNGSNVGDYDELFTYLTMPRYSGMMIKAVHNQSTISFYAYVSNAERELYRIDDKNNIVYWKEMTINIVSMKAQVLPL